MDLHAVVSGPTRGTISAYVEVAPRWVPQLRESRRAPAGKPISSEDPGRYCDALLAPNNVPLRIGFFEHLERSPTTC